jgi:predicted transcriptional regulator
MSSYAGSWASTDSGANFGESNKTMDTLELRSEIKGFIDRIQNPGVLQRLRSLLAKAAEQDALTAEMVRMAQLSEEAIAKGEVYTREEVEAWIKEQRHGR